MAHSKVRKAIWEGVKARTHAFIEEVFPQASDAWTPEQLAIYNFLNGESGGLSVIHESHRGEIAKSLRKIAGIEEMTSRHMLSSIVDIPPYAVIILRESVDSYPEGFPLIHGRIQGYWTEQGRGSSTDITTRAKNLRPTTDDDINAIMERFPEERLYHLYGAIEFSNKKKLRDAIALNIHERTVEFGTHLVEHYPEGITDKGKAIMQLRRLPGTLDGEFLKALSIILDDPAMLEPYHPAPETIVFSPFVAVVHNTTDNGQTYEAGKVHVQANVNPPDIFLSLPGEPGIIGNHADSRVAAFRIATEEEIKAYAKAIPDDSLHLYTSALSVETITSLL